MHFSTDEPWVLVVSIVLWSVSTVLIWRGALLGSRQHAAPRLFLALCSTALVAAYVCDLFGWVHHHDVLSAIRGIGWVMAVALAATAWTGVRFGRRLTEKVERAAEVFGPVEDDDDGRD